jgi:methyl-accepting chemotaxis protein
VSIVTAVVKADIAGEVVCGIDISLRRLTEIINDLHIGRSGYIVLLEKDGTILAHPAAGAQYQKYCHTRHS